MAKRRAKALSFDDISIRALDRVWSHDFMTAAQRRRLSVEWIKAHRRTKHRRKVSR